MNALSKTLMALVALAGVAVGQHPLRLGATHQGLRPVPSAHRHDVRSHNPGFVSPHTRFHQPRGVYRTPYRPWPSYYVHQHRPFFSDFGHRYCVAPRPFVYRPWPRYCV